MRKAFSRVDVWQLARTQGEQEGSAALNEFVRLLSDLPEQPARMVQWQLAGETDSHGRPFLNVHAHTTLVLECQRCLTLFDYSLQAHTRVQLVKTEEELADESVEEDPDVPDRVLGSAHFDVLAFVEDELILALPYVPKHEVCPSLPDELESAQGSDSRRPSPFSVLSELKKD